MYALDTNTIAYFFKGMGGVGMRLMAVPPGQVEVSAIVAYQLAVGVAKSPEASRRRDQLARFLSSIDSYRSDPMKRRLLPGFGRNLEQWGVPIGPLDVLIPRELRWREKRCSARCPRSRSRGPPGAPGSWTPAAVRERRAFKLSPSSALGERA